LFPRFFVDLVAKWLLAVLMLCLTLVLEGRSVPCTCHWRHGSGQASDRGAKHPTFDVFRRKFCFLRGLDLLLHRSRESTCVM